MYRRERFGALTLFRGCGGLGWGIPWDWRTTTKLNPDGSGKLYLHVMQWPVDGKCTWASTYKVHPVQERLLVEPPKINVEASVTTEGELSTLSL